MLDTVANRLLPHEHSQPIPCDLFCARKISIVGSTHTNPTRKSGQSLIEHSYKADSDLSPAGWEYAERLREFVTERRAAALEQRGYDPSDRRLVVRPRFLSPVRHRTLCRFGLRPVVALTTPPGHSNQYHPRCPPCHWTLVPLQSQLAHPHPNSMSK